MGQAIPVRTNRLWSARGVSPAVHTVKWALVVHVFEASAGLSCLLHAARSQGRIMPRVVGWLLRMPSRPGDRGQDSDLVNLTREFIR